ncbi:MAG: FG-GAP repeat domain-containing protein, partial [Myxococcota bacterium]
MTAMKNENVMLRTTIATTTALASLMPLPVVADGKLSSAAAAQPPLTNTGEPWFVECAAARGLQFQHVSGHQQRHFMPEIMGGGAALFDMDSDGDLDALLVQSGSLIDPQAMSSHRLFRNRGDGFFDDITQASGLPRGSGYGMGIASADYDNDGDVDLYITAYGPNMLLRNDGPTDGGHRFTDVTAAAGVGHD